MSGDEQSCQTETNGVIQQGDQREDQTCSAQPHPRSEPRQVLHLGLELKP